MLNLFNAQIKSMSLHRVGNKSRNEQCFFSEKEFQIPNDEVCGILKEYFLKPFREKSEDYLGFVHDVDLEYNEMYNLVTDIFNREDTSHEISKKITRHMYDQSGHPHIKTGEVCVVVFENIYIGEEKVEAIGIYKSEVKSNFFQFDDDKTNLKLNLAEGVSLEKIDKGVIIFNIEKDAGYKLLTIDGNKYDTRYWMEHFLSVDLFKDENYNTKKYLQSCLGFADNVIVDAEDSISGCNFKNKSLNYFASNDVFDEEDYIKNVFDNPDLADEFRNWKHNQGAKYGIDDVHKFDISNHAVNEMRKKFKSKIDLDTNIQIKIDILTADKASQFIEKGWDEEKQMYYYLLYFNKEN